MPIRSKPIVPTDLAIARARQAVMERLNQQTYLSQDFCLVNSEMEAEAWRVFKDRMKEAFLDPTSKESKQDFDILEIMTTKEGLARFLDDSLSQKYLQGTPLTYEEKRQIQNTRFKRKQLFIKFELFKRTQSELLDYSQAISISCNGELSCPPGAYEGVKSFTGALDKITKRERTSDFWDLKDVARMTIKFDNMNDLITAKSLIMLTKEFDQVRHCQKALKDRYGTCVGESARFNVESNAYQDIKFFLRMPSGMIGELQLNTKNMLVAKEQEHLIYDLVRQAPKQYDGKAPYAINNRDALSKVAQKMNQEWFQFVETRTYNTHSFLNIMKQMIERLNQNISRGSYSLTVTGQEYEAMKRVSLAIYDCIGRGMGSGTGQRVNSTSIWSRIKDVFFS